MKTEDSSTESPRSLDLADLKRVKIVNDPLLRERSMLKLCTRLVETPLPADLAARAASLHTLRTRSNIMMILKGFLSER